MEQGHGLSCCQEKNPYLPAKCCVDSSSQVGTGFPEEASGSNLKFGFDTKKMVSLDNEK